MPAKKIFTFGNDQYNIHLETYGKVWRHECILSFMSSIVPIKANKNLWISGQISKHHFLSPNLITSQSKYEKFAYFDMSQYPNLKCIVYLII